MDHKYYLDKYYNNNLTVWLVKNKYMPVLSRACQLSLIFSLHKHVQYLSFAPILLHRTPHVRLPINVAHLENVQKKYFNVF